MHWQHCCSRSAQGRPLSQPDCDFPCSVISHHYTPRLSPVKKTGAHVHKEVWGGCHTLMVNVNSLLGRWQHRRVRNAPVFCSVPSPLLCCAPYPPPPPFPLGAGGRVYLPVVGFALGGAAVCVVEPHPLQLPARPGGSQLRPGSLHHVLAGDISVLPGHHGADGPLLRGTVRGVEVGGGECVSLSLSVDFPVCVCVCRLALDCSFDPPCWVALVFPFFSPVGKRSHAM